MLKFFEQNKNENVLPYKGGLLYKDLKIMSAGKFNEKLYITEKGLRDSLSSFEMAPLLEKVSQEVSYLSGDFDNNRVVGFLLGQPKVIDGAVVSDVYVPYLYVSLGDPVISNIEILLGKSVDPNNTDEEGILYVDEFNMISAVLSYSPWEEEVSEVEVEDVDE